MDFSEYQTEIIEDIKSCLEGLQVQPILFMGAGVSQRYLKAPDWENLLKYLAETCPLITRPYEVTSLGITTPDLAVLLILARHFSCRIASLRVQATVKS